MTVPLLPSLHPLVAPRGIRERAKAERRQRIKEAATATFREKGYANATTREIAERAGVAKGTVFLYALDKRDLLRLVINDDLEELTRAAFERVDAASPLDEQLMHVFLPRYEYWGAYPDLALHALGHPHIGWIADADEEGQPPPGGSLLTNLIRLLANAQAAGRARRDADPRAMAEVLIAIYHRKVFRWLHDRQVPQRTGAAELRHALELAIDGIGAQVLR